LDSGSWKALKTGMLLALSLQLAFSATVLADDSASSFGSILPQSSVGGGGPFRTQSPFSDMLRAPSSGTSPGDNFSAPSMGAGGSPVTGGGPAFPSMGNSSLDDSNQQSSSASAGTDISNSLGDQRVNAWYKFLEPSLNLSRQLESQRKRLLSIVPMPLDLRGAAAVKSDNRFILLRAENSPDYACFKTIYGLVFARAGALAIVTTGKNVRLMNLNGKEKDVLFQLSNGQVITLGPGSEMVISKYLDNHEVNVPDSIARRGFTKPMRCNDLSMAFSQFSYATLFAVPEMHYFLKTQNKTYVESLNGLVAKLDEIRGTSNFKTALTEEQLKARRKQLEQNYIASGANKQQTVALRPAINASARISSPIQTPPALDEKSPAMKSQADRAAEEGKRKENARKLAAEEKRKNARAKLEQENRKIAEDRAIEEQRQMAIAKAKSEDARSKQEALQKKLAKKKANSADAAAAAAVRSDDDARVESTAAGAAGKGEGAARRILGSLPSMKWKSGAGAVLPKPGKSTAARSSSSISTNTSAPSGPVKMLLPKMVPTEDTPPEIAKLLLDAIQEEKNARALRKKADKCMSYVDCGMLSYEQQKKMLIEARQHIKDANEAEERCQALRRQAQTASSGRASVQ
jgi:hypothetical protein